MGSTVPALPLLLLCKLPAREIWPVTQYSICCTLVGACSDSPVLDLPHESPIPISEPEPDVDVSLTDLVSGGTLWLLQLWLIFSTTSIESQGSRLLLPQSQMTIPQNFPKHWYLTEPFLYLRENIINITYKVVKKMCVVAVQLMCNIHEIWSERNEERHEM